MQWVILWTDYLVYVLLILLILGFINILSNRVIKAKFASILMVPKNLIAAILLLTYLIVGVTDSIHFNNTEKQYPNLPASFSVLDYLLKPAIKTQEKTFSAPFALKSFVKENITINNNLVRDFPRLNYGGQHLFDQEGSLIKTRTEDIIPKIKQSILESIILTGGIFIVLLVLVALKQKSYNLDTYISKALIGKTDFPWRVLLVMLFILIVLVDLIYNLMPYYHILGTSQVGEDVLYQALKSIRTGLIIGSFTTLIMIPIAIGFGLTAGFFRGLADDIIQYIYTVISAVPQVLLIAAAVLSLQVYMSQNTQFFSDLNSRIDARLIALCFVIGVTSWTGLCRILRAECLKLSQIDFVKSATVLGSSRFLILFKHILPNVMHLVLITAALDFSGLVLAEAVLSYIGVGVDPSTYSWGTMINSARLEMAREPVVWWTLFAAFSFMFGLVLAANVFADALRDTFDPRS